MTEQAQQIALCEWMGWRILMHEDGWRSPICPNTGIHVGFWSTEAEAKSHYPDTNSLDVLHEMEKRLTEVQQGEYSTRLADRGGKKWFWDFDTIHAPASQRREALLKTLNLWKT